MAKTILFDLGNTLVRYYQAEEFGPILRNSIALVMEELESRGIASICSNLAMDVAMGETRAATDYRFYPMEKRLERIFSLSLAADEKLANHLCEVFLEQIFAMGVVYDDTREVLTQLKSEGYKLGLVSNLPWGSPPKLWHNELQRLGLAEQFDSITLCGDVGWRKPAKQIFETAAAALDTPCSNCLFVGDDLQWDIAGSQAVGMQPVLLDRHERHAGFSGDRVVNLQQLYSFVSAGNKRS